jgi:hypothetical protein
MRGSSPLGLSNLPTAVTSGFINVIENSFQKLSLNDFKAADQFSG